MTDNALVVSASTTPAEDRRGFIGLSQCAEFIRCAYRDGGMTQSEIARALGCTQPAIAYQMKRCGITARASIKRDQCGALNASWKGDAVSYKGAHCRVSLYRGRPMKCEHCNRCGGRVIYDWANLSGAFHNVRDYKRLCRPCHRKFDAARKRSARVRGRQ